MALPKTVHVVCLGTTAAPLSRYLRGHDDAVSWTADVAQAIPFLSADAAKRYAARRLGGAWHVEEVERAGRREVLLDDEADPEERDALEAAGFAVFTRPLHESVLLPREDGLRLQAYRDAIRAKVSSPWAV